MFILGNAMSLGQSRPRAGGGAGTGTITFIGAAGANAATIQPTGLQAGTDVVVGVVMKPTNTAPTFDPDGGNLLGSYSGNGSSCILFWKYAESDTPKFGTHANGNRSQYFAFRFSDPPANPIGAFGRVAAAAGLTMAWGGLTLQRPGSHVITMGYRAADDPIIQRTGTVTVSGGAGVSARYMPLRSDGPASAWAAENPTQLVSGVSQSISLELGYAA